MANEVALPTRLSAVKLRFGTIGTSIWAESHVAGHNSDYERQYAFEQRAVVHLNHQGNLTGASDTYNAVATTTTARATPVLSLIHI